MRWPILSVLCRPWKLRARIETLIACLADWIIDRRPRGLIGKMASRSEIVAFTKSGGPLTKRISLDRAGELKSDGSACVMTRGVARRAPLSSVDELAELIEALKSDQAIALG